MVSGGIWNTVTQLGFILTSGLDLLICNTWIGSIAMGQMSFPKQLYGIVTGFISTLVTAYQPTFVKLYAEDKKNELIDKLKEAMALCGILSSVVMADIIVYGKNFLDLYIPNQDTSLIWILMILSLQVLLVSGTLYPLYYIYTLTNKLKLNSYVEIVAGLLNVLIVYILINNTEIGIYAVAGVSTSIGIIKNFIFTPTYSAHCLNVSKLTFYKPIFQYIFAVVLMILINYGISKFVFVNSWFKLGIVGLISIIVGVIVGFAIILDYKSRRSIIAKFKRG